MESWQNPPESRRILIGTAHGMIEGDVALGPKLRTLDYLNRSATRFVPLRAARSLTARRSLQGGNVQVNIATILWVSEVEAMRRDESAAARPQLNRSAVRLCLAECEILGFIHTPAQGDPLARLNQERSPFLAVTSASILGSDTERAAAFLAVNSEHIVTVELLAGDDSVEDGASVFEKTTS